MVKGYLSWPTWTSLPPYLPTDTPFDVGVYLRVFSGEGFRQNDGWPRQPGTAFRDLLEMLKRFIRFGPSFFANMECPPGGLPAEWQASERLEVERVVPPEIAPSDEYYSRNILVSSGHPFKIRKLSVNISFHDLYTPDTWPETTYNIFKLLKELATVGVARDMIGSVDVHCEYLRKGQQKVFDAQWDVSQQVDEARLKDWVNTGFLEAGTRNLGEAYPTSSG